VAWTGGGVNRAVLSNLGMSMVSTCGSAQVSTTRACSPCLVLMLWHGTERFGPELRLGAAMGYVACFVPARSARLAKVTNWKGLQGCWVAD
jgi:hypothetical protein